MYSDSTIPASQFTAISELLALQEDNTIASGEASHGQPVRAMPETEKDWLIQTQICGGKCSELSSKLDPALLLSRPSNECSTLPKSSALSISSASEFGLSGLRISFGKTLPYLLRKTVTRRTWKDSHALKFTNAFHQHKLVKALDKDIRYGGKQIGWCWLLCAPYKEKLSSMPEEDLIAEGGMCSSVPEFIKRYFKDNSSQEVWVIRFQFATLNQLASTNTPELLGVYSDSTIEARDNSATTPSVESIHQAQLISCGVYPDSETTTGSNSPISSVNDSIHQALLAPLDVYSLIQNTANKNFAVALSTSSVHQASITPLGVYYALEPKTNSNCAFYLSNQSIHQALPNNQTVPGLYQNNGKQANANSPISSPEQSIHQSLTPSLGVYPSDGNQSDTNATKDSLAESIHQTPVVQGGSGLVYSFWKGESMVNHYRYKVKVNGKWKVKSVYIPVGKLPKVREAITNKLGVTAIVTELLGRQL